MVKTALARFLRDETGQDLVEYALLSGIVSVAGILLYKEIVDHMGAAYASWHAGARAAWEPCPPGACP